MGRDLAKFVNTSKYQLPFMLKLMAWTLIQNTIFKIFWLPSRLRVALLRLFGAQIGKGVLIRRGVKIHFPWNLKIGENCWVGEEVWFINHEKIVIGSHVCISQRSVICSGGHDYRSASLEYSHKPIKIKDGAWICLDAKVLPGITVGECAVVSAGEIARQSLPDFSILISGQIRAIDRLS